MVLELHIQHRHMYNLHAHEVTCVHATTILHLIVHVHFVHVDVPAVSHRPRLIGLPSTITFAE